MVESRYSKDFLINPKYSVSLGGNLSGMHDHGI